MGVEDNKLETGVAHLLPGEGRRSLWMMGEMVTCKVTSAQTSGAYSLFEVTTQPGEGPPPHVQHWEDESFYVLEGVYEFLLEDRSTRMGAGSSVYVPKGNLHAHKNVGDGLGRMLVSYTPGRTHERFFEEVGRPVEDRLSPSSPEGLPSMEQIAAIAAEYGIEIQTKGSASDRFEDAALGSAPAEDAAKKGVGDERAGDPCNRGDRLAREPGGRAAG